MHPTPSPQRNWRVIAPWIAVGLVLGALLALLWTTLTPLIAAGVLAYLLARPVDWLQRFGLGRAGASLLTMLLGIAAVVAIALVFVPVLQTEGELVRQQLPDLAARVSDSLRPWIERTTGVRLHLDASSIRAWLARQWSDGGTDLAANVFDYARSGGSAALEVISLVLLVPIVLFYLLLDWPTVCANSLALVPPRWRAGLIEAMRELDEMIMGWLHGVVLLTVSLAVFYGASLWVAGFALWWPLGLLTGLLMFVPYLGFALALGLALVAGMLQFGLIEGAWRVALVYALGQAIESWWLTPKLVGERIGLHPLTVILALLIFGSLFGFIGVLLALPFAAAALVVLRRLRRAWLQSAVFLGQDGSQR